MRQQKKQWKPRIINVMADGTEIEDLTGYVIPASHQYYRIIKSIDAKENQA